MTLIFKAGARNDENNYRKKFSMETAVVYCINYFFDHMDRQMTAGVAFIDLRKAFDLISHECILYKPEHDEMRGSSFDRFWDYLTLDTKTEDTFWKRHPKLVSRKAQF